ncbi:carbonic anhydrase [Actinoplanes palleronii]|uniref:carbonic anhydrase n=1 Tax=Actinoplanes palleronii TaxID=113570 RepID=A0ABQ4BFL0_9ACTN|nr:carbonic anhydrase [Actinoplanes palleronii]GIE69468.1 carbonic anhydrase [Actinoplanes palleronii]
MSTVENLIARNAGFAVQQFVPGLKINPSGRTMVIGCVDPRVDPLLVLGLEPGEAAIIRNVGGRVTPALFKTMKMLGQVGKANGGAPGGDWNLIVLHHTDCGMTDLAAFPDLLAEYFEIPADRLPDKSVSDPFGSARLDASLLASPDSPAHGWHVTGLVYDVETGLVRRTDADA